MGKQYYEAYDERYKQVHEQGLQWASDTPSPIVIDTIQACALPTTAAILEIGCGEGRDAYSLLSQGFDVLATDVSTEAVRYCRQMFPAFSTHFQVMDCVRDKLDAKFDFIYAIAVVHMLVADDDRNAFYRFVRDHLHDNGVALIGTMGDGQLERQTDIQAAFALTERVHGSTGQTLRIATTSCRMVGFATLKEELTRNGLEIDKQGITAVEPDFPQMMFALVKRKQ